MRALRFWAILPLVLIFAGSLFGGPMHPLGDQDPTGVFGTNDPGFSWVRGWRFQVNDNINVTQLGATTPMGTNQAFTVVLWDSANQTQLATSDFTGTGNATWQWHDLSSAVALASGSTYIVSIFAASGSYYLTSPPASWMPTGTIQYLDMRYANEATVNSFPTQVLPGFQYGVPDIGYVSADTGVPEPGTLGLAGLALALLVLKRRA
jgi:hypothetical protein